MRGRARPVPLPDELYRRGERLRDKYLPSTDADLLFGLATNASVGRPLGGEPLDIGVGGFGVPTASSLS